MKSLHILVVDDELAVRQLLKRQLSNEGHVVEEAADGDEALLRLAKGDVDIALCDMRMPGIDGIEVIDRAQSFNIETMFILMTAFASIDTAIQAMQAGAYDYMVKPVHLNEVLQRFERISDVIRQREEIDRLKAEIGDYGHDYCQVPSQAMQDVMDLVAKMTPTQGTILLTGESGTGKGVIARLVHGNSSRKDSPLISVNCGAIPENLLESELFGHQKGAFTGADSAKKGLFREADGGTLFLDEIGELPISMQVKLLHVLDDKVIRPVGSSHEYKVNVRIIAATNKNLEEQVKEGLFREDLFYRLNVLHIHIPPLRERTEDVETLVGYFIRREAVELGLDRRFSVDPLVMDILVHHPWRGNLRELQNVIQRMLVLAESDVLTLSDLPGKVGEKNEDIQPGARTLPQQIRECEINIIMESIKDSGGDRRVAASKLGIGVSTLYRKLENVDAS